MVIAATVIWIVGILMALVAGFGFTLETQPHDTEEFKELCDAYGNICLRCGEEKPLSVDHVIPLCDGGSNSIDNIQPLCVDCNCIKGRKATDYRELYGTE